MLSLEPQWLAGLVGVVVPLIVRWLAGTNIARKWKSFIAIAVSVVVGFASSFLSGNFNVSAVMSSTAFAFSVSQVFYDQVFKDILK